MSLLAIQSFLARLYTDSALRARFFESPDEVWAGAGLSAAEQEQLSALDRRQVERFAQSLRQKRLGAARELLPGTARVLGDGFAEAFARYCDEQPSALERRDEAIAFAAWLLQTAPQPRSGEGLPGYFADLLRCEQLAIEVLYPMADSRRPTPTPGVETPVCTCETHLRGFSQQPIPVGRSGECEPGLIARSAGVARSPEEWRDARPRLTSRARVAAFQYDMAALFPKLLGGEVGETLPDPCYILIGKVRDAPRARLKRINAATARLLMLSDGTRPLGEIVTDVAAGLRLRPTERPAFAAECARFLTPLLESGLIGLAPVDGRDRDVSTALHQAEL